MPFFTACSIIISFNIRRDTRFEVNMQVLLLTLGQCGLLFTFIVIGYFLNKGKILSDVKALSTLLMWVFLPALVFDTFYKNFTWAKISQAVPYLIAGGVITVVGLLIFGRWLRKKYEDRITRSTYLYSLVISNLAYLGFPLISAVFPELYLYFVVFTIVPHLYIFTLGRTMFEPDGGKFSWKGLLSPIMIGLFLGLLCGPIFDVASIKLPSVVEKIITTAANCMSPIAMLITGFTLARLPLKKVFANKDTYLMTALRLLVIPAVCGGVAYLAHLWLGLPVGVVQIIVIYCALPMGLNPVVFSEANGGDGTVGAQGAFISHAFCLATLPFVFWLVSLL